MDMLIIIAILCYLVPAFDCFEILIFRLKVIFSLFPLLLSILETTIFVLFYKYIDKKQTISTIHNIIIIGDFFYGRQTKSRTGNPTSP